MAEEKEREERLMKYIREYIFEDKHKGGKRGRPKEGIPDKNSVSPKTLRDLESPDFWMRRIAFSEVSTTFGSHRKAEKWLKKYYPAIPITRKRLAEYQKSDEQLKRTLFG